ncbi:hypothetical protein [Streptomyces broussonetiae]|uniref:Lipoprotein n=1 Tax=Streptomyces broussonetiae TaxID=2686304 RepID=A0ABV5EFL5_9ACTN
MRYRVVVALAVLGTLAAACTPPTDSDASRDTPSPTPTDQVRDVGRDVTPPELDEASGEGLAGQQAVTKGSAGFDYAAGAKGRALIVAVSCGGAGTIKVNVPAVALSFATECGTETPAVTYNQAAVRAAHKAGTVSVEAPSTVSWSATVGRGDPVQEAY